MPPHGSIRLILGPMYSMKTTELIHSIRRYTIARKKCIIVNYAADQQRFNDKEHVTTHDDLKSEAAMAEKLTSSLITKLHDYDVIGINEGQFFENLASVAQNLANQGKIVIIAALNGNFRAEQWKYISELIPLCDQIDLRKAICVTCGEEAIYTRRDNIEDTRTEVIDTEYSPACRKCFEPYLNQILSRKTSS